MQTCKLEITELHTEARQLLYGLTQQLREATNFIWRQWEAWHTNDGTQDKLVACMAADKEWRTADKATRGTRPKWSVQPWPKELANSLYHKLTRRFPGLNSRVLVLLMQRLRTNICTKQSSAVAMKWWIAILLDLDSRGCARHPQPIPFDSANAKVLPADELGRVWLEVRLDRIVREGKKNGVSTVLRAALKTGGKRAAYASPAREMAAGTRKLSGAQMTFDAKGKKWFAALTYHPDPAEELELTDETAVLRPGLRSCWLLRIGGRTLRLGGRGHHVAHVRKALLLQRLGRQHSYTYSPKRKGRSRERALVPLFKLQSRWNNFTKSCNQLLVAGVVEESLRQRVGKVVLVGGRQDRVLATAGKIEGREDSTGWPWYQVEQLLQQKCNRHSIKVELRELFGVSAQRQLPKVKAVAR